MKEYEMTDIQRKAIFYSEQGLIYTNRNDTIE